MKNFIQFVNSIMMIALVAFGLFAIGGVNPIVTAGTLTAFSLFVEMPKGALFTTPATNVEAITKWAGMYSKQFLAQMLNGLDIFQDFQVDRMVSRQGKLLPKFTAQGGLRPLNLNVEENGGTERSWSGRKLLVYDAMKIFKIVPEELIESFLSDMIAPGAKEIPFAQWVWQKEMDKLSAEINDNFWNADYAGNAAAWASGTAYTFSASVPTYVTFGTDESIYKLLSTTTAGQSPTTTPSKWQQVNALAIVTGPGTIIKDEIAASNLSPVSAAAGSITSSNAMDKIEAMYNAMTVAHRSKGGEFRVSPDVYRKILLHERSVFPYEAGKDSADGKKYVWGSGKKWAFREVSSMGTSQRIVATTFENIQVGTNLRDTPGVTKTVETLHGYKAVSKFLLGSEIADLECLYVNDQA